MDPDGVERSGGTSRRAGRRRLGRRGGGWRGLTWRPTGTRECAFRRRFDNPDEAAAIFDQIAGEDGPFQDFAVPATPRSPRTEWGFTGRIDFRGASRRSGTRARRRADRRTPRPERRGDRGATGRAPSRVIQVAVGVGCPGTWHRTPREPTTAACGGSLRRGRGRHGGAGRGGPHRQPRRGRLGGDPRRVPPPRTYSCD